MQDFRNLKIWQKSHEPAKLVYLAAEDFPRGELFGLRNSLRKTSIEISVYSAKAVVNPAMLNSPLFRTFIGICQSA
jgi:hypothetical protein